MYDTIVKAIKERRISGLKFDEWFYDKTEPFVQKIGAVIKAIAALVLCLLGLGVVLFVVYWVGKAILGFIKYYSQFA